MSCVSVSAGDDGFGRADGIVPSARAVTPAPVAVLAYAALPAFESLAALTAAARAEGAVTTTGQGGARPTGALSGETLLSAAVTQNGSAEALESGGRPAEVIAVRSDEYLERTRVILDLDGAARFAVAAGATPLETVIELSGVRWRATSSGSASGASLLEGYSFVAEPGTGRGRLLIHALQPLRVRAAFALPPSGGQGHRIVIERDGPTGQQAALPAGGRAAAASGQAAAEAPPEVLALRIGEQPGRTRLVLDVSRPLPFSVTPGSAAETLLVNLPGVRWRAPQQASLGDAGLLRDYDFTELPTGPGGQLLVRGAEPLRIRSAFAMAPEDGFGHRIIIDLDSGPAGNLAADLLGVPIEDDEALPEAGATSLAQVDAAAETPAEQAEQIRFTLAAVELQGNGVFTTGELEMLWAGRIGQEVSLAEVFALAEAVTRHYRNAGYILCKAIVPPQRVRDGLVRLQVIEGFIDKVVVEGDLQWRDGLFKAWTEKIQAARPITADVLERYTLLADDLPGATVKSVLRPSETTPGASNLVMVVAQKHVDLTAGVDNRATETAGPYQVYASATGNSLLGLHETTTLTYLNATDWEETQYVALAHEETLDDEGTTATVTAAYSRSVAGDVLKELDLRSSTKSLELQVRHPFLRSRKSNLVGFGGVKALNSESTALSSRLFDDRLRIANIGASFDISDEFDGDNGLTLQLSQGFEAFGASDSDSDSLSRSDGNSEFTKVTFDAWRLQQLPDGFSLLGSVSGQLASSPLLASEEFGFGGAQFGRAYDSSEITGDHGFALSLEGRYTGSLDWASLDGYYQLYGFWDYGQTWDIGGEADTGTRSASSAGLGLRLGFSDYLTGSFEIARPLTRSVASADDGEGHDVRAFFSLSARY